MVQQTPAYLRQHPQGPQPHRGTVLRFSGLITQGPDVEQSPLKPDILKQIGLASDKHTVHYLVLSANHSPLHLIVLAPGDKDRWDSGQSAVSEGDPQDIWDPAEQQ